MANHVFCLAALTTVTAQAFDDIENTIFTPSDFSTVAVTVPPPSVGEFRVEGPYDGPSGSVPYANLALGSSGLGEWWVNNSSGDPWGAAAVKDGRFAYHHRADVGGGGFVYAAWSFDVQYFDYTSSFRLTDGQIPNGSIISFGLSNGGVPYPTAIADWNIEDVFGMSFTDVSGGLDLNAYRTKATGPGPSAADFPGTAAFSWQSYEVTGGAVNGTPSGNDLRMEIKQPDTPMTDYVVFVQLPPSESLNADGRSFLDLSSNQMKGLGMTDEIVFNWTIDSKSDTVGNPNPQYGVNVIPCSLEFTDGSGGAPLYLVGSDLFIEVSDPAANTNAGAADTLTVTLTNEESGEIETLTLTETGVNTGLFTNTVGFPTSDTGNTGNNSGVLNVQFGNTITASTLTGGVGAPCTDSYLFPTEANLTKAVDLAEAVPGDLLTYTIIPRYPGAGGVLTNVVVTDGVPANTVISGSPGQGGSHNGGTPGTVTWNLGSVTAASDGLVPGAVGGPGVNYEDDFSSTNYELNSTGGPANTTENNSSGSTAWTTNWVAQVLESGGGGSDSKVKFNNDVELKSKDGSNGDFARISRVVPLAGQADATVQIITGEDVKLAGGSVSFQARYSSSAPWVTLYSFADNDDETDFGSKTMSEATLGGALTNTAEIRFEVISDGGGESKLKLDEVTLNGTVVGQPELSSSVSAFPLLLADGDLLTVEVELGADLTGVTGVSPSNFLPDLTNSNGATLTLQTGPVPATADLAAGSSQVFTYTYLVDTDSATAPGSFSFQADGSGEGGTVNWATATSNSVLVSPPLTYTVAIDDSFVGLIPNIATISDSSGTIPPTDSNEVETVVESTSLGNYVWLDENGDGVQDAGEDGIPGVLVELRDENGILIESTRTDANGGYLFTNVAPNVERTVVVVPSSLPTGLTNQTGDPDGTLDGEHTVTLSPGEDDLTADFGYNYAPAGDTDTPPSGALGAIGDRIWNDANSDGIQDAGEAGIAGVEVKLFTDPDGNGVYDTPAGTTTTNVHGNYIFDGLAPSSYRVEVTPPSGYTQTIGDPDSTIDNATTSPVILAPGDVFLNADFGYVFGGDAADIGDTVYLDVNGNGTFEPATDVGIAGVTVALLDAANNVIATMTTDANGTYLFPGLPSGLEYNVKVTDTDNVLGGLVQTGDPDPTIDGQSNIASLSVSGNLDQDFGYSPPGYLGGAGYIGDTVYIDTDNNSALSTGEGIEGVTVELYDATGTNLITSTVTNNNGTYGFAGLDPAATYVVKVDTTGTLAGLTNIEDPQGPPDSESIVDLSTGSGIDLDQDFGYAGPNDISGLVWLDPDADGTRAGNEPGRFGGVTVDLIDANGNIIAQTTTLPDGSYSFDNVPDGTYTVDVTDDANVLAGYWHSLGSDSAPDPAPVTVNSGNTSTTIDFGYYKDLASLGNYVWLDAGLDGIQEAGAGVAGVELTLTITYPNTDVITVKTFTDANGNYSFDNLLADEDYPAGGGIGQPTYNIEVTVPSGYLSTLSDQGIGGSQDFLDSDLSGVSALPVQGLEDVTSQDPASGESVNASYDFGLTVAKDVTFAGFVATNGLTDDDAEPGATGGNPLAGNPDGDIYNNLLEYVFCLPPGDGTNPFVPFCTVVNSGLGIDLIFNRVKGLTDVRLTVEGTDDIVDANGPGSWTPLSVMEPGGVVTGLIAPTTVVQPNAAVNFEEVTFADIDNVAPLTEDLGFVRLKVELLDGGGGVLQTSYTSICGWQEAFRKQQCESHNIPFLKHPVFSGMISGFTASAITVDSAVTGNFPALDANTYYYVEVIDGENCGHRFEVASASGDTLVLDLSDENSTLASLPASLVGDQFVLREHWTILELFPTESFLGSSSAATADRLLFFDPNATSDAGAFESIYLYNPPPPSPPSLPSPPQWTKAGDGTYGDKGGRPIYPGKALYTHPRLSSGGVTLKNTGVVRENKFYLPLHKGDQFIGGGFPVDQSPNDRLLLEPNFKGSTSSATADQILLWKGDYTIGLEGYYANFLLHFPSNSLRYWTPSFTNPVGAQYDDINGDKFLEFDRGIFLRLRDDDPDYFTPVPW